MNWKKLVSLTRETIKSQLSIFLWIRKKFGVQHKTHIKCLGWCTQFYLELLEKLQTQICRAVGPSLAASLEPLAHHWNVASLSLFSIGITLVDFLQNWLNWFYFVFLEGGLLIILIDCMIFLSPFLDVTSMSMSTVSFLTQVDSGILCLQEYFPLTYNPNGFKLV